MIGVWDRTLDWHNDRLWEMTLDGVVTSPSAAVLDHRSTGLAFDVSGPTLCPTCGNGVIEAPGEDCDDGNALDGDCCSSTCRLDPAGASCDEGNPCTDDQCDGAGTCLRSHNTVPCDDGAFCNGPDTCAGGACSVHAGDPCTGGGECADTCDEIDDTCQLPAGTPCEDGVFCNGADTCAGGSCSEHSGDPCTQCGDTCEEGTDSCTNPIPDGSSCDDGLFCNGTDTCVDGLCDTHSGDPCAAGAECADACHESTDSCFDPEGTTCTSDSNDCTDDRCDGTGVCTHLANSLPCDDGDPCSTNDTCSGGTCAGSVADGDADGTFDGCDNCPADFNADQRNSDTQDGGDLCDVCPADPLDQCEANASAAGTIDTGGGTLAPLNGSASIVVPPGTLPGPTSISITGGLANSSYGLGAGSTISLTEFQPEGVTFDPPVAVTFGWADLDDDGRVDGTGVAEKNLKIFRNGAALFAARTCQDFDGNGCTPASCCDQDANLWTVERGEFSEYGLAADCTSVGARTKMTIAKLLTPPGDDRLTFKGFFILPEDTTLNDVDPSLHGSASSSPIRPAQGST
jgi:hypothetical protein